MSLLSYVLVGIYLVTTYNIGFLQTKKWPNGKIPYHLDSSLTTIDIIMIKDCIREWEGNTPVKFVEVKNPKFFSVYYDIYKKKYDKNEKCYLASTVGYGFSAHMVLTCGYNRSNISHELGHCLGLWHEHQRPDRDKYVIIDWSKLTIKDYKDYRILFKSEFLYDYKKYPYDFKSIMHYKYNITCRDKTKRCIIRNYFMTKTDYNKIRDIYGSE